MTEQKNTSGYRIEERTLIEGSWYPGLIAWADNRENALDLFDKQCSRRASKYTPDSGYRLVLTGPDRAVKP